MKLKAISSLLSLIIGITMVNAAKADPLLNYNFIDASYAWESYSGNDYRNGNGLDANVSWSPIEHFFLEGGYEYMYSRLNSTGIDINNNLFNYGVGGYLPLDECFHLVGRVGGLHLDQTTRRGNSSDDGVYAGIELRAALSPIFELNPSVLYSHFPGNSTTWEYSLNTLVAVADSLALIGGAGINDESDVKLTIGARLVW